MQIRESIKLQMPNQELYFIKLYENNSILIFDLVDNINCLMKIIVKHV